MNRGREGEPGRTPEELSVSFNRLPVRIVANGGQGVHIVVEVTQDLRFITHSETFIPSRDQMQVLSRFMQVSKQRLIAETRLERTRQAEDPSGDTIASESSVYPMVVQARRGGDFIELAKGLKGKNIPSWKAKEGVRDSRIGLPMSGNKMGQIPEEAMVALDKMTDEVSLVYGEMSKDEFIEKWGEYNLPSGIEDSKDR